MSSNIKELSKPAQFLTYFISVHIPLFCLTVYLLVTTFDYKITILSFLISYVIIYIYGTNIFYHRYWAHKQFTTHPLIEKFFSIAGLLSLSGSPIGYVLMHRLHHAYSDTDKDPHSPIHGKYHAFAGWLFNSHKIQPSFMIVKDLLKHNWLINLEIYKTYIVYSIVLTSLLISPAVTLGILLASLLTFFIELSINAFLHDPIKKEAMNAGSILCWLTAGGLKHKLHHDGSNKITTEDPGYYFVKLI